MKTLIASIWLAALLVSCSGDSSGTDATGPSLDIDAPDVSVLPSDVPMIMDTAVPSEAGEDVSPGDLEPDDNADPAISIVDDGTPSGPDNKPEGPSSLGLPCTIGGDGCGPNFVCDKIEAVCLRKCESESDCFPSSCPTFPSHACIERDGLKVCTPRGCWGSSEYLTLLIPSIEPTCPMWGGDVFSPVYDLPKQTLQAAGWRVQPYGIDILLGFRCLELSGWCGDYWGEDHLEIQIYQYAEESEILIGEDAAAATHQLESYHTCSVTCRGKTIGPFTGGITIDTRDDKYLEGTFHLLGQMILVGGGCGGQYIGDVGWENGWFRAKKLPDDLTGFPPSPTDDWWD